MALGNLDLNAITEADLQSLKDVGVPEGLMLDYKGVLYGRSDADVKEFLKDISSFANTAGGHLVIGMTENGEGVPDAIAPLSGNLDQELLRLENLARDGIEPRLIAVRMRAVPVQGGFVIVVRVPRSFNPPHRVSARNTNRIYGRNSAGAYELSMDELRVLFTTGAALLDRVRAFRAARLASLEAEEGLVPLVPDGGRVVLHLLPFSAFSTPDQIDLEAAYRIQHNLRPLAADGYSPGINVDGFSNRSGPPQFARAYTHVFRNGAIEAVKNRAHFEHQDRRITSTQDLLPVVLGAVPPYMAALQQLGVSPPVVCLLALQGMQGVMIGIPTQGRLRESEPLRRSLLELPEIIVNDFGTPQDYQKALRPIFDALWNAAGLARCSLYDEAGNWVGPPIP